MSIREQDRTFAEVADRFIAWQGSQTASIIERAWRRLGWRVSFVAGLSEACACCVSECLAVLCLPAWAELAPPGVREALIKDVRDRWEQGAHAAFYASWVDRLFYEVAAVLAEDMGLAFE